MNAPVTEAKNLATKEYVDNAINQKTKDPVRAATTQNLTGTYALGIFTLSDVGTLVIDGVTLEAGDRVLVKNQTDGTQNGIYTVTDEGDTETACVLTRTADFDSTEDIPRNVFVRVMEGSSQADVLFQLTNDGVITLDTTVLVFQKYGTGGSTVGKYSTFLTGNGTATEFIISHNLNAAVTVALYDQNGNMVMTDITVNTVNSLTISFAVAPTSEKTYTVVVIG